LDVNRESFDAEVLGLDFSSPKAVSTINDWVKDKTEGLIDSIIEQSDRDVMMYLINAIYFKGQWMYEFDADHTSDESFSNADGAQKTVPMMSLHGTLPYASLDNLSLIDLPYGDSLYSMTIVLPHSTESIDELAASLTSETWDEWTAKLRPVELDLFLPRFEIDYFSSLRSVLVDMGMTDAFSNAADFSRINSDQELFISNVLHKTVLKVNEEGTEAAAVTAVEMRATSVGEEVIFRVDHPFILAIREKNSGAILFAGKIMTL
jgi:serpin B